MTTRSAHQLPATPLPLAETGPASFTQSDLKRARQQATFPTRDLSVVLYGAPTLSLRERIHAIVSKEPIFQKDARFFWGRSERMEQSMKISRRLLELTKQYQWSPEERQYASELIDEYLPITLHEAMFLPVLRSQGTDEQVKKWLPLAENYRIIGCYAQTELGHGSNLGGLETTATFERNGDCFILHSPSLTATKWWIGGLGLMATHAVVQAKLILSGKDYGPHAFIVALRDLQTHEPLPGITVGDIGPKKGFAAIDNGFVRFDHVRVPRDQLLQRFARVDAEGRYIAPPHAKIGYGGMVLIRVRLVHESARIIARGACVAVRYCAVRRQFQDKQLDNATKEVTVLNYQMVQYRLLPLLAQAYCFHFAGMQLWKEYAEMEKGLLRNDATLLPFIHGTCSALKAYCTQEAANALEESRKVCGGHGYSAFSGLPYLFANYVATNTYEGENTVLTQQAARFLLKESNHPELRYLTVNGLHEHEPLLAIFAHRSKYFVHQLKEQKRQEPWHLLNVQCHQTSQAHSEYICLLRFSRAIQTIQVASVKEALNRLVQLFALHCIHRDAASFLISGAVSVDQSHVLKRDFLALLPAVARDAVALVDAFDFSDFELNSALGATDGRVYERLWQWAQREPLNSTHKEKIRGVMQETMLPVVRGQLGQVVYNKSKL